MVTMVSGVTMEIHVEASETIPGALTAVAHVQSKLQSKYKVNEMDNYHNGFWGHDGGETHTFPSDITEVHAYCTFEPLVCYLRS